MKTIIVLGMHCSATSLVSEGLSRCTVDMGCGPGSNNNGFNPWGVWEDMRIRLLNDDILDRAGGAWDNPPHENKILAAGKIVEPYIKELLKLRRNEAIKNKKNLWGWKDPRTILTIRCFLPFLENPNFFSCLREPMEVAKSLNRRNQFPIEKGLELVNEYNRRMMKFLQELI